MQQWDYAMGYLAKLPDTSPDELPTRFEFRDLSAADSIEFGFRFDLLIHAGDNGWELVTSTRNVKGSVIEWIFKRPRLA